MRDGFILHEKTMTQVALLDDAQAGELLKAMIAHYKGEEMDTSQIVSIVMVDAKERMDADTEAYERVSASRSEAGRAGAEARWGCQNDGKEMANDGKAMANDGKRIANDSKQMANDGVSVSVSVLKEKGSLKRTQKEKPDLMPAVQKIVDYLNAKAGTSYKPNSRATVDLIKGRMGEHWKVEDFIKVIDNMTAAWKGDPKMEGYLRPSTLFARAHFEEYLNKPPAPPGKKLTGSFANFPQRTDDANREMQRKVIAMQLGG